MKNLLLISFIAVLFSLPLLSNKPATTIKALKHSITTRAGVADYWVIKDRNITENKEAGNYTVNVLLGLYFDLSDSQTNFDTPLQIHEFNFTNSTSTPTDQTIYNKALLEGTQVDSVTFVKYFEPIY